MVKAALVFEVVNHVKQKKYNVYAQCKLYKFVNMCKFVNNVLRIFFKLFNQEVCKTPVK